MKKVKATPRSTATKSKNIPTSGLTGLRKTKASDAKSKDLEFHVSDPAGQPMTTDHGVPIEDDQNSLKAGDRGPTLIEDFILREKITHFDHERIPERIVHARGSGAHGVFQLYKSLSNVTRAKFLTDPTTSTPVFVRFSTVAGSRGSTDLARDVRGFAVKFYTQEGNFDLVGNNMPVFFIQDAIKFPDLIHAVKPEPHNEIPQAASAHDTFWDFISLTPESAHMIMWVMSDRAIPRSLRMMEGFGVHTFRLINAAGEANFVKFHWKPLLGIHSVVWDEAQRISGCDPDFHRRDLYDAIQNGDFPEWELGVQIVPERDEHKYDFDLLDPTKLIPEELVPVQRVGKMTLNRNPDNFFAEVEQVAFHIGNIVPGIDFTNDPLLQGRLFSYTDTQLIRLGGPNFHEIPINRPVIPVNNNQRDGFMRQMINRGRTSYSPNTLGGNFPAQVPSAEGGFTSFMERMSGSKVRQRSKSFFDHFSQAAMFFQSQSEPEQNHIVRALRFELGKVETPAVRERMLYFLSQINDGLAANVAKGLGMQVPAKIDPPLNQNVSADGDPAAVQPEKFKGKAFISPALSMAKTITTPKTRKIAALVADGCDDAGVNAVKKALEAEGAILKIVGIHGGMIRGTSGAELQVDYSLLTTSSVLFDGVYIPGGEDSVDTLAAEIKTGDFVQSTYYHCKPIACTGEGLAIVQSIKTSKDISLEGPEKEVLVSAGIIVATDALAPKVGAALVKALSGPRAWERELPLDRSIDKPSPKSKSFDKVQS